MNAWRATGGGLLAALVLASCAGGGSGCASKPSEPDADPPIVEANLPAGTVQGPLVVEGDTLFQGAGVALTTVVAPADGPVLVVPAGVQVILRDLKLQGADRQHTVVSLGSLIVERVEVSGGRAAFRIEAGDATFSQLFVHDAEAALRLIAGEATVTDAMAERVSSAAYFVAGGTLTGLRLRAREAEYGLLTRPDGRVELDDLDVRNVTQAGVGLVGGAGTLKNVVLEGPMPAGGVVANDLLVPALIEDLRVSNVAGVGVQVLRGETTLRRVTIQTVAGDSVGDLGMGLFFHGAGVTLEDVAVRQAHGGGLQMIGTSGSADGLALEDNGSHGIEAWGASTLGVAGASLQRNAGLGILAREGSSLTVSDGDLRTNTAGAAMAECATSAEVRLSSGVLAEDPLGTCVSRY
ncbi:MAG: right-handed parallel beta-helix repeat-containing protein [Deltaproteobacteria bacterium]|nr:right-handed parallel beta-helix repeat-containing protein [Deltaproteobacteria bacterium]